MSGDDVNDVPALSAAHVGVAMGRCGTDAAAQAADIVLTDDDYSSIVRAIARGRTIYDNVLRTSCSPPTSARSWSSPSPSGPVSVRR